jgi:hypothetical protein
VKAEDIISSGLLELYAAGLSNEEESVQVENWQSIYPEVARELEQIYSALEKYSGTGAIEPAAEVKDKLLSAIGINEKKQVVSLHKTQDDKASASIFYWKRVAAAVVILLMGSLAINILIYNKYEFNHKTLLQVKQDFSSLQQKNKATEDEANAMKEEMSVVQNKYSMPVSLHGMPAAPDAAAKIFWMQNSGEVYIDPANLPEAPDGKQYQLWAIVDGKPIDAGMILTTKKGDKYRIQKMKSFGKAQAFAVTLETEAGNPAPKGPMLVMGTM